MRLLALALLMVTLFIPVLASAKVGDQVDCSAAYYEPNRKITCEVIGCSADYQTFLGSWEGPFTALDQASGKMRAYRNQVTYSPEDCLKNIDSTHSDLGDVFIIGRQVDIFPALIENGKTIALDKIELALLITGKNSAGKPFLRTVNSANKRNDYSLVYKDEKTITSVWSLFQKNGYCDENGKCYDVKILTFDGKDMAFKEGHKRDVRISLEVLEPGTEIKVHEMELSRGYHVLRR